MENIKKMIEEKLVEIDKIENPCNYVKELTKFLDRMHPSDAHIIIRDKVIPSKNKRVQECKRTDVEVYQTFQSLMMECKESFNHDRAFATNLDVDKAVTKAYGIAMRTLRANMDMEKVRFDKLTKAINKIEEHLGLDVTNFEEGDDNDTTEHEDAQRIEEVTTGTGEVSKTE